MIQGGSGVAQLGVALAAAPFAPETATRIRADIAARLLAVVAVKPDYAQLRIIGIGDGGRELIRVDHGGPGGTVRIAPDAELIRVGDQDFFQRAIGQSDIYASPVALENDGGAGRAVPMLHLAIPLWSRDGQPFGLSVIDLNLESKFDRIRADTAGDNLVFISNGAGTICSTLIAVARSDPRPGLRGAFRMIFRHSLQRWPAAATATAFGRIEMACGSE